MDDSQNASSSSRKVIASRIYKTSNGHYRIVCIPVSKGDSWISSLELLESKSELKQFSRAAAIMRLAESEEVQIPQLEERTEAPGFEGLGHTILSMLDRYKIDNVMISSTSSNKFFNVMKISVMVKDFSLMRAADDRSLEQVCRFTKDFLLELYSSLVEFKIIEVRPDDASTLKHFDLPLPGLPETVKCKQAHAKGKEPRRPLDMEFKVAPTNQLKQERPNCVFDLKTYAPQRERQIDDLKVQKQVIENSLKVKAQEIERCAQLLEDKDFAQIQSLSRFHNYEIVRKVFQILMVINGLSPDSDVVEFTKTFDVRNFVRFGSVAMLNPEKMESVSVLLRATPGLSYEAVKSFNKKFGILFQYMLSLVRCYDLNLRYALILHQIEQRKVAKSEANQSMNDRQLPPLESTYTHSRSTQRMEVPVTTFEFQGLPPPAKPLAKEPYFSKDIRLKYKRLELLQQMEERARQESGSDADYDVTLMTKPRMQEHKSGYQRRAPGT